MAGGALKPDPAIDRYNVMRESVYKHFQWTPRVVRVAVAGLIVIPGAMYAVAVYGTDRWDFGGKRRGVALTDFSK